jgi:hypothetical protein
MSPFLERLEIEHGPAGLLGRFFLRADAAARERGLTLWLATLEDLRVFNGRQNPDWPLMPMFEPGRDGLPLHDAFSILGTSAGGEIVATQAARVYRMPSTSLRRESESLRLFFGSGEPPVDAACSISAPAANAIAGTVVYSGGGWYHRDFRGLDLSAILPRMSRALAYTRWESDFTVSFVDWKLVHKGVAARYGYTNLDDGVVMSHVLPNEEFQAALAWMPREQLLDDLSQFLLWRGTEVDRAVEHGRRQDKPVAASG